MKIIPSSELNPESDLLSRRRFTRGLVLTAASIALVACSSDRVYQPTPRIDTSTPSLNDEFGDPATSLESITTYNNFYEFSTDKKTVSRIASQLVTSPWQITVGGLVRNPGIFDIDDLRKIFDQEERIYRMRCVEGWSMVIPWLGFPLAKLIQKVEPTSEARYIRFESIYAPKQLPGQQDKQFPFPYIEGLTLAEGLHDLSFLGMGIYGKSLLPQNGAPIRLVVPWKYGFKSTKSIVRIDFVDRMPSSFWMSSSPQEYGFYANVNPDVPHRRWSQSSETRFSEVTPRQTRKFNGYDQVSGLYQNLDLKIWY